MFARRGRRSSSRLLMKPRGEVGGFGVGEVGGEIHGDVTNTPDGLTGLFHCVVFVLWST